jgi:hypothetical protein
MLVLDRRKSGVGIILLLVCGVAIWPMMLGWGRDVM